MSRDFKLAYVVQHGILHFWDLHGRACFGHLLIPGWELDVADPDVADLNSPYSLMQNCPNPPVDPGLR